MHFKYKVLQSLPLSEHSRVRSDTHFEVDNVESFIASSLCHAVVPLSVTQNVIDIQFSVLQYFLYVSSHRHDQQHSHDNAHYHT